MCGYTEDKLFFNKPFFSPFKENFFIFGNNFNTSIKLLSTALVNKLSERLIFLRKGCVFKFKDIYSIVLFVRLLLYKFNSSNTSKCDKLSIIIFILSSPINWSKL